MTTIIDEVIARQRLHAVIPKLTDTEVSAALRAINGALDLHTREAAMEQLADSGENGLEWLMAFAELCRLFVLDDSPAKSAADIH